MTSKIQLGDTVQDLITGFRGVAVAHHRYLHGCDRFSVQPEKLGSDKKPIDPQTFDLPQLRLIRKGKVFNQVSQRAERPGGPQPEPQSKSAPLR